MKAEIVDPWKIVMMDVIPGMTPYMRGQLLRRIRERGEIAQKRIYDAECEHAFIEREIQKLQIQIEEAAK
jgi:hypothetical protein